MDSMTTNEMVSLVGGQTRTIEQDTALGVSCGYAILIAAGVSAASAGTGTLAAAAVAGPACAGAAAGAAAT
jgi:hypothetical protein